MKKILFSLILFFCTAYSMQAQIDLTLPAQIDLERDSVLDLAPYPENSEIFTIQTLSDPDVYSIRLMADTTAGYCIILAPGGKMTLDPNTNRLQMTSTPAGIVDPVSCVRIRVWAHRK